MKARLILLVLLSLQFACIEEVRGNDDDGYETHTYRVSQGAKNKALLMRVFEAVGKIEDGKQVKGKRSLQVTQVINATEFLVSGGGTKEYWFVALKAKDLNNRDRFRADAELTDETRTFLNEAGKTITFRVLQEVASKPAPEFTKDDFVERLKDGETWTLKEFEERKCLVCGGDGTVVVLEQEEECSDCIDGKIVVDFLVKW